MELWGYPNGVFRVSNRYCLLQIIRNAMDPESRESSPLFRPCDVENHENSEEWPQNISDIEPCLSNPDGSIDSGPFGYIHPIGLRINPQLLNYRWSPSTSEVNEHDFISQDMWRNFTLTTDSGHYIRYEDHQNNRTHTRARFEACRLGPPERTRIVITQGHHRLRLCNQLQAQGVRNDVFFEVPEFNGLNAEEILAMPRRFDPLICYSLPQRPEHRRRVSVNTMSLGATRPLLEWVLRPGGMSRDGVHFHFEEEYGQYHWNPSHWYSSSGHSDPHALSFARGLVQLLQPQLTQEGAPALQRHESNRNLALALGGILVSLGLGLLTYFHMRSQTKTDKRMTLREARKIFASVSVDISAKAEAGRLDPVLGREQEMAQLFEILEANQLSGAQVPALVGERGVGKSALMEGLAQAIKDCRLPQFKGWRVIEVDIPSLVAGTGVRGTFEDKVKAVVMVLENTPNTVFFFDEVHMIIGAGRTTDSTIDAAQILKNCLARRGINAVVGTTVEEYIKYIMRDAALESRFSPLEIGQVRGEVRAEIVRGNRAFIIGLSEDMDRAAHERPRTIVLEDPVLERLSEIIGGNSRELKKTLGRLVARVRTNSQPGARLEITHAILDSVISEINSARRALGQVEFDLASHPAPSVQVQRHVPMVASPSTSTSPATSSIASPSPSGILPWREVWNTSLGENAAIVRALESIDPELHRLWTTEIAPAGETFATLGELIVRLEAINPDFVDRAHRALTNGSSTQALTDSPHRALYALLNQTREGLQETASRNTGRPRPAPQHTGTYEEREIVFRVSLGVERVELRAGRMSVDIERERRELLERRENASSRNTNTGTGSH